jgi:DNA polymerase III delta prime subunit
MIDTHLVLIEGLPGSGKSTTAQKLAEEITNSGKSCQCFLEWDIDHPIPIGDDFNLGKVIASSRKREPSVLQQWQQLVQATRSQKLVTVLESRFWQTSVMLMYIAGLPKADVLASNQRVITAIQPLKPVLIYFAIDDPQIFAKRTVQLKEVEWQRSGIPGSWAQHLYDAVDSQPWMMQRRLTGLEGMLALWEEWAQVSDELYARLPFPKIMIRNPHEDWPAAMKQMRDFLGLD